MVSHGLTEDTTAYLEELVHLARHIDSKIYIKYSKNYIISGPLIMALFFKL